ncbi:hypothetical protein ACFFR3_05295 [Nonomuraea salmonea]|uniref:Uncharacterized protein n=2 Tax=Nonomuraea salmonea TaxID=46181 RepID=A0ABV5NGI2_9ACTN
MAAVELGSINAAAYNASPWVRAVFEHVTATVTVPEEWRRPPTPDQPPRHHVRHRLFDTLSDAQAATPSDLEPLGLITLDSLPTAIAQALQSHPYNTLVGPIRDALGWHVATATPPETPAPAPPHQAAQSTPHTQTIITAPAESLSTASPHQTTVTTPPGQTITITPSPGTTVPTSPSPMAATAPQSDEPQSDEPEGIVQTLPHPTSRPTGHDHDLLAAARRKAFARWLDDMRARKVTLVPGLEHPGDPRQPDNHHKH